MRLHPRLLSLALAAVALLPHVTRAQVLVPGFTDSVVAQNLDLPTAFDFLPDGRVLLVESWSGRVRLIVNGQLSATDPVMTVPGLRWSGERGLLGVAIDPQFPARPYFYTHHTATDGFIHVTRWTLTGDLDGTGSGALSADPASRYALLDELPDAAGNHNGGTVRFGTDGMLYVSLGDDAVNCAAQDLDLLQGKILRLRVDALPPGPGTAFFGQITPPDNPYVARPDSGSRLVYAYGLRNPFRFQLDDVAQRLVIGDVGLEEFEEISLLGMPGISGPGVATQGGNMGWPWREGLQFYLSCGGTEPPSFAPIYAFDRTALPGASIISGGAYRAQPGGQNFPNRYEGDVFFSEYYSGKVYRLEPAGATWTIAPPESGQQDPTAWATGFESVTDWRVGPDGALWACRQYVDGGFRNAGTIERIVYTSTTSVPPGNTAPGLRLSSYPTPARDQVTFAYDSRSTLPLSLRVYDLRGRVVRELSVQGPVAGGSGATVAWDTLDEEGRKVPNGVYFARLQAGSAHTRCGVVVVR